MESIYNYSFILLSEFKMLINKDILFIKFSLQYLQNDQT